MNGLLDRVYSRIGAPRCKNGDFRTKEGAQSIFDNLLNARLLKVALALPTPVRRAVVANRETVFDHD